MFLRVIGVWLYDGTFLFLCKLLAAGIWIEPDLLKRSGQPHEGLHGMSQTGVSVMAELSFNDSSNNHRISQGNCKQIC